MANFIEVEQYSPDSPITFKLFVNPNDISLLKQEGIFALIVLSCGMELKVSENVSQILALCSQKTSGKYRILKKN